MRGNRMVDYSVKFDLSPLDELDKFALLACQSYNFGNATDWFGSFRGGIYAVFHRVNGVKRHYSEVHSWTTQRRFFADAEYHLSSLFFNMDSTLECLVFGINALGNAIEPALFRDVTDSKSLRDVSPTDVCSEFKPPLAGYTKYFSRFQSLWQKRITLIDEIREQHDVSKHREIIFVGGKARSDAPPGFFEALEIKDDPAARMLFQPMAEIFLKRDPKAPNVARKLTAVDHGRLLEDLATEFVDLINETSRLVLQDAKANILLPHNEFIEK